MPEPGLNDISERFEQVICRIAYGNEAIEDYFPGNYQDSGAWDIMLQELPTLGSCYIKTALAYQEESGTLIKFWPGNKNPLTQGDLLKNEEDQVQELIFQIRRSISITYKDNLANKLLTLFNDAKEEDPYSLGMSAGSLRSFTNFLLSHTNLKCPTISLTPDYNIYASWRCEQNRVFSVHFFPNGDARFVIFKPNNRHPERITRISGVATTDILMETVVIPNRIEEWISE
jgi:hypothetical protein